MKFNELKSNRHHTSKRLGRGIASGKGKTSGRGTKGQGARTGSSRRPGFTGGQNPIMQKLPKLPGFNSYRKKAVTVHTGQLEQFAGQTVDATLLARNNLVRDPYVFVKLIRGKGELTKKVDVRLPAASLSAIEQLQQTGGTFETVPRLQHPAAKQQSDNK